VAELRKAKDGIFATHAHADHCGLAAEVGGELRLYMTEETSKMLLANRLFARRRRCGEIC